MEVTDKDSRDHEALLGISGQTGQRGASEVFSVRMVILEDEVLVVREDTLDPKESKDLQDPKDQQVLLLHLAPVPPDSPSQS